MNAFFNYVYEFIVWIAQNIWSAIKGIGQAIVRIFDINHYSQLFDSYKDKFGAGGWIMAVITHLLVAVILFMGAYLIIRFIKNNLKIHYSNNNSSIVIICDSVIIRYIGYSYIFIIRIKKTFIVCTLISN